MTITATRPIRTRPIGTSPFVAAAHAYQAATAPVRAETEANSVAFQSKLTFLVAVGYLTHQQAETLLRWFRSEGVYPLMPIPGPAWVDGLTLYEILRTASTLATAGRSEFDPYGFLGHLVGVVADRVGGVLESAPGILQAAVDVLEELE
jgi:hypothetical protein